MTERENFPSKIVTQDVVVTTTQRGNLGVMYDRGTGVTQDDDEAVRGGDWQQLKVMLRHSITLG